MKLHYSNKWYALDETLVQHVGENKQKASIRFKVKLSSKFPKLEGILLSKSSLATIVMLQVMAYSVKTKRCDWKLNKVKTHGFLSNFATKNTIIMYSNRT